MACPISCSHTHVYGKKDFDQVRKKLNSMDVISSLEFKSSRKLWEAEQKVLCDNFIPSQIFIDIIGLSIETDKVVQREINDIIVNNGIVNGEILKSIEVEKLLKIKNKLIVDNINVPIKTIIKDYANIGELKYTINMGKYKGYTLNIKPFINPNVCGLYYHDIDIYLSINLKTAKWYKRFAFIF